MTGRIASIDAFEILDSRGNPTLRVAFVLGCQSRDGAFARASVALPDIELTHQALEIIAVLAPVALRAGRSQPHPTFRAKA